MRKIATLLTLLFATNLWAYRARPVSDFRFSGRMLPSFDAMASDGTHFLVLTSIGSTDEHHAFVQKVVDGQAIGPQREIGAGRAAGLVWTGSHYLAAWTGFRGTFVTPVSRDGSPLSPPIGPIRGLLGFLAADATSALAFGYIGGTLTAQPLALDGSVTGPAIVHATPDAWESMVTVAPAADGFAMVFRASTGTWLMLFRANGSAITSSPILLDETGTNFMSRRAAVATDGTDTLIAFGVGAELRNVVVAANGTITSKRAIPFANAVSLRAAGLVWDGSQYVAAINVSKDPYGDDLDAALVRITRTGERAGEISWLAERPGLQEIGSLESNGRELLLTLRDVPSANAELYCLAVNPSTLQPEAQSTLGRTLPAQDHLAIAAGANGYLAAWVDRSEGVTSLRASRVDADGSYLDGEGIVLDTLTGDGEATIAIEGNGPQWLVIWSDGDDVRARFVSRGGAAGIGPIAIGPGFKAAARWDGSRYVVLHSDGSLHSARVSTNGVVSDAKIVAASQHIVEANGWRDIYYLDPSLVRLNGRNIAVYRRAEHVCDNNTELPCPAEQTALGLRLDAIDTEPFVIADDVTTGVQATESPAGALVTWFERGTFLPATSPENSTAPFHIPGTDRTTSSYAFDGRDFIAAWERWDDARTTVETARITIDGTITDYVAIALDAGESTFTPTLAASETMPPVVGFVQRHAATDGIARAAFLFVSEMNQPAAPLPAPSITGAAQNVDGTITVRWQPMQNIFGMAIELRLSDGTFRPIGVAPAGATSARVSTAGLEGDAVRVRAWNATGLSAPSPFTTIVSGRRRSARR